MATVKTLTINQGEVWQTCAEMHVGSAAGAQVYDTEPDRERMRMIAINCS